MAKCAIALLGGISFTSVDIETAKSFDSISTLTSDHGIIVKPVTSSNPITSTHRVVGRSPQGRLVDCGGIWKKQNKESVANYFTLSIRDYGFSANPGKAVN